MRAVNTRNHVDIIKIIVRGMRDIHCLVAGGSGHERILHERDGSAVETIG